ncbi:hypothetical protein AM500_11010 [Bacillus sp. FJAT-18017]|uniref:hypothetical protein n=1 Tax=unclassified Bacillus (in: firmicutes) TaxID=185979 RepID=UPI0005C4A415|nr:MULTISPECIES: hypothetical protein [unclassified Bacillus (in: firmicutes)]ALC90253.1 hypothetical protein AM500_11010 [Bacillus sp. FJAT-18017]
MDFSAELYDINAWVALYTGFYLAIALKYLLLWAIENPVSILDRPNQPAGLGFSVYQQTNSRLNQNFIVMWIGKYIRMKYCPTEDPEASLSFLN